MTKLLHFWRELVVSFLEHILFRSDSKSKVQNFSDNGSDKSEKSVPTIDFIDFHWLFTFVAVSVRKVLVLRLRVWTIQDMLEKADDEISSNLQKFWDEKNISKKFFGDEFR